MLQRGGREYQTLTQIMNKLKENICQLVENQKAFSSICSRFESWLSETEDKLNKEQTKFKIQRLAIQ